MSECQFEELKQWLSKLHEDPDTAGAPKIIASASLLLPRKIEHQVQDLTGAVSLATSLRCDSWQGYPWSTHELLHHIVSRKIRNVIFLSGDEHLFCFAKARIRERGSEDSVLIHSIHCSPLYAPLPFANAIAAEFAREELREFDEFSFQPPSQAATYDCKVWADVPKAVRNGFTELIVARDAERWSVKARFHDNGRDNNGKPIVVEHALTEADGI
jgi:phosphodiesterase/alkaline phosphatase D-like protein